MHVVGKQVKTEGRRGKRRRREGEKIGEAVRWYRVESAKKYRSPGAQPSPRSGGVA